MAVNTRSARLMGAAALIVLSTGVAAEGRTLTGDDYARAERYVGYNVTPLVDHAVQTVTWLDDTHFWYRDHDATGDRFMRFDVDTGKAEPAFDHARLATALGKVLGKTTSADGPRAKTHLPASQASARQR